MEGGVPLMQQVWESIQSRGQQGVGVVVVLSSRRLDCMNGTAWPNSEISGHAGCC